MDQLSRRDFLCTAVLPPVALLLAATVPLGASLPALVLAEEPATPAPAPDPYRNDELPIMGFAGECSGFHA